MTGSRDWTDWRAMVTLLEPHDRAILLHGDCPTGADHIADRYGRHRGWTVVRLGVSPHEWRTIGKKAGTERNTTLVRLLTMYRRDGYACHAYVFPLPQSHGTWDCMRKLTAAGFAVTQS